MVQLSQDNTLHAKDLIALAGRTIDAAELQETAYLLKQVKDFSESFPEQFSVSPDGSVTSFRVQAELENLALEPLFGNDDSQRVVIYSDMGRVVYRSSADGNGNGNGLHHAVETILNFDPSTRRQACRLIYIRSTNMGDEQAKRLGLLEGYNKSAAERLLGALNIG